MDMTKTKLEMKEFTLGLCEIIKENGVLTSSIIAAGGLAGTVLGLSSATGQHIQPEFLENLVKYGPVAASTAVGTVYGAGLGFYYGIYVAHTEKWVNTTIKGGALGGTVSATLSVTALTTCYGLAYGLAKMM